MQSRRQAARWHAAGSSSRSRATVVRSAPTASTSRRPPPARRSPCSACPAPSRRPARPSTCPGYVAQAADAEGRRRRRDLVRVGERRLRDGRLGSRPEVRRQGAHDGRRQRRLSKATGLTLDLTARGMGLRSNRYSMLVKRRRGQVAQCRGAGQVRGQRRRHAACGRPKNFASLAV